MVPVCSAFCLQKVEPVVPGWGSGRAAWKVAGSGHCACLCIHVPPFPSALGFAEYVATLEPEVTSLWLYSVWGLGGGVRQASTGV